MSRAIADIRVFPVAIPLKRAFWFALEAYTKIEEIVIEIETDDGFIGVGQVKGRPHEQILRILDELRKMLIGQDPSEIESLHRRFFNMTFSRAASQFITEPGQPHFGSGAAPQIMAATSGIDIALWDIRAQTAGVPLSRLLGGRCESVAAYASGGYYGPDGDANIAELVEEMTGYASLGFGAVKMKVGGLSIKEDVARVQAVRQALPEIDLMLDANTAYDVPSAIEAARAYEPFAVAWFEEPVAWFDPVFGLARVRQASSIPLAVGERESHRFGCRDLVDHAAISYLQVDCTRAGGISEWLKIASYASSHGVLMAPHHEPQIHGHLLDAVENGYILEAFPNPVRDPLWTGLFARKPEIVQGRLVLTETPGIGVEVDHDFIERYASAR